MHIEYRITEKDYRAAAQLVMRKRTALSLVDFYGPYLFALVWIAGCVITSYVTNSQLDMILTLGVVPLMFGFLSMRRKRIRQEYLKAKAFHLLQTLDLDGNGLRLVTTAGTARSAWTVYSKFQEDEKSFVLFLQGSQAFVPIPKGELTLAQIDELRSLLTARVSKE
jgi:hypothetical protein